jgi:hypothetical protein
MKPLSALGVPTRAQIGIGLILIGAVAAQIGLGLIIAYAWCFSGLFLIYLAAREIQ